MSDLDRQRLRIEQLLRQAVNEAASEEEARTFAVQALRQLVLHSGTATWKLAEKKFIVSFPGEVPRRAPSVLDSVDDAMSDAFRKRTPPKKSVIDEAFAQHRRAPPPSPPDPNEQWTSVKPSAASSKSRRSSGSFRGLTMQKANATFRCPTCKRYVSKGDSYWKAGPFLSCSDPACKEDLRERFEDSV